MRIPPDPEPYKSECMFRVNAEDVPSELLPKIEKCLRAENAYCNLEEIIKKPRERKDEKNETM